MEFGDTTTLDFGCGEGHVAKEIAGHAKKVIGFDVKKHDTWTSKAGPNLAFTRSLDDVEKGGPYDRIVLYDVLDHLKGVHPLEMLEFLRPLLAPGGIAFCRCHPWTARHGGHLYEKINKAYVHLALTPDELASAGYVPEHNLKLVKPMAAYGSWFEMAGFTVMNRKVTQDPVPEYFHGPLLERICKVTWAGKMEPDQAIKIMANQFVDYLLGT